MVSEITFHKKTSFPKKVNVLRTYVLPSRMRVRECSPKKKEIDKNKKNVKRLSKKTPKKGMDELSKILQRIIKQLSKNQHKIH